MTTLATGLALGHFLALGAVLFCIAVAGIFLNRKNVIVLLMCIELLLLSVNINFVAFSRHLGDASGQVFVFFILTVAAAEAAIGLAILVTLFRKQVGRIGSHVVTIAGVALSCGLSCWVLYQLVGQGAPAFNENLYTWFSVGGYESHVGFMVDKLTAMMMVVVTFVSLLVHVYTIGYMEEDPGYQRFFSYISLFTFSMLMLVMANNFMQLFFGWEAVGLVSYLLIGFWFKRPTAIFANLKAFLVNRVGDFGFILGIAAVLFCIAVAGIFLNRKNVIVLLMCIELLLLSVNINFVAFSRELGDAAGQVFVFFILTVAAAEAAIGLAILVTLFRNRRTINVAELDSLKG